MGTGPPDVVYLSNWDVGIEFLWDEPSQIGFFGGLASFSRLVLFDKRGTGAFESVSLSAMPTLESWIDDVITVMDEVESERAFLLATTWSGPLAILSAAIRPDRIAGLVLHNTFARRRWAPDYECGRSDEDIERGIAEELEEWGTGNFWGSVAPSFATDDRLRRWWNRCNCLSLTPRSAAAFGRLLSYSDVRDVLHSIQVPTLVVADETHTGPGRYIADRVPGAKMKTVPTVDNLPWLNESLVGDVEEFITGVPSVSEPDRALATVLFTDFVNSTAKLAELGDKKWRSILEQHDAIAAKELQRHRGRLVGSTGDGLVAIFDGPARGVRCAQALIDAVRPLGVEVRAGLHCGEIEVRGDEIGGLAVHIGQRVSALAGPGEVLVSRTVTDLVVGSGLQFADRGEHELKGVPGTWAIYSVKT